jgi:ribosomal protein S18 acetylase RimI-like enzyme
VSETSDRVLLREFLEKDRLFSAYALCDLDDREFMRTRWGLATADSRPIALVLQYAGYSPQPLFVLGENAGIAAVLESVIRPRTAYVASRSENLASLSASYRIDSGPPMVRMWVDREHFRPEAGDVRRLLPEARLAVVGNVMTHADFRGRGYAKAATGAVTAELLRFCDQVVLNVRADNPPALAAYRRLGYQVYVTFEERLIHRSEPPWSGWSGTFRRLFSRKES